MKFGFEREFFVTKNGEYCLAEGLPKDDCGYLAEVRGEPHTDPAKALALYLIEEARVIELARSLGMKLHLHDYVALPPKLKNKWLRMFGKGPAVDEGSMYGKFWSGNLSRAGLHIHFSNQREIIDSRGYNQIVAGIIDMPKFIFGLDKIFAEEIKTAKRVPGLYEMKAHGFEYRSLPTSIDMNKVVKALNHLQYNRWDSSVKLFPERVLVKV